MSLYTVINPVLTINGTSITINEVSFNGKSEPFSFTGTLNNAPSKNFEGVQINGGLDFDPDTAGNVNFEVVIAANTAAISITFFNGGELVAVLDNTLTSRFSSEGNGNWNSQVQ